MIAVERVKLIERLRRATRNSDILALCDEAERLAHLVEQRTWKHALYRHFDIGGTLLYVGISISAINRLAQHKSESPWFEAIARIEIEKFSTRDASLEAERRTIQTEGPLYNIQHRDRSNGFDKRSYQRELMRKRRAAQKAASGVTAA